MSLKKIQVLKVDAPLEKPARDGRPAYTQYFAQIALLDDDGVLQKVAQMSIPERFREKVVLGTFSCTFGCDVGTWGKDQGRLITVLEDLTPITFASKSGSALKSA